MRIPQVISAVDGLLTSMDLFRVFAEGKDSPKLERFVVSCWSYFDSLFRYGVFRESDETEGQVFT